MSQIASAQAFALFREVERRSQQHAAGIPQEAQIRETWSGVIFNVFERQYVSSMEQVSELLNFPSAITPVPGTLAWIRGVANVRGSLLPLIDLQIFLGGKATVTNRRSRVLVINMQGFYAGLLVTNVVGMRNFDEADRVADPSVVKADARYVQSAFSFEGSAWNVFDMTRLLADPRFMQASH